ncbi:hypothetical protein SUGI_0220170 [Cryptomeria japonica]|nr:hypothetical protein SUGI_0220170 [Cryptomeria japonica]
MRRSYLSAGPTPTWQVKFSMHLLRVTVWRVEVPYFRSDAVNLYISILYVVVIRITSEFHHNAKQNVEVEAFRSNKIRTDFTPTGVPTQFTWFDSFHRNRDTDNNYGVDLALGIQNISAVGFINGQPCSMFISFDNCSAR